VIDVTRPPLPTEAVEETPAVQLPPDEACVPGGDVQQCVEAHALTGSVLIAKDWDIVFEGGFGLADIETGRLNTPDTVFRIGSVTKQFTAALILLLQEDFSGISKRRKHND
jgi:CubicO group peptidase (beta-lactamase class C family)